MDDLAVIVARCRCGIFVEVNQHRDYHEKAADVLENLYSEDEIEPDVRQRMIDTDTIATVQVYPDTPNGFYRAVHYDVFVALRMVRETVEKLPPATS